MGSRDLLFRARLGFPWVTGLLVASCFLVTTPLWIDPRRFYLTLGVDYCEETGIVHWWHYIVAHFVHGTGCPLPAFPPIGLHVGINVALFVLQGMMMERVLGAGRAAAVTFTSLAVQNPLIYFLIDGRGHGASGMTWSYLVFVIAWLAWLRKREGWSMLRDGVTDVSIVLALLAIVGLVKHWHLWNVLVSVPFYWAWRKTMRANFAAIAQGRAPDHGSARGSAIGIAIAAAIFLFNLHFVVAAAVGWIRPGA